MIVQEDTTLGDKFTVLVAGSVIIEQGIRAAKDIVVVTRQFLSPGMNITSMAEQIVHSGLNTQTPLQQKIVQSLRLSKEHRHVVKKNHMDGNIDARSRQGCFDCPETGFSGYCPTMVASSNAEPDCLDQKRLVCPTPVDV